MKKLLVIVPIFLFSCVSDEPDKPEAKITYPELSSQSDFDDLLTKSEATLTLESSKEMLFKAIARTMNIIEIANQEAGEIADSSRRPELLYKATGRAFNILAVDIKRCEPAAEESDNLNTESLIWNDKDNNNEPSLGDEWFYILEGCENQSNASSITGVLSFTGMANPFDTEVSEENTTGFTDHLFSYDLQIDNKNGVSAFLQDAKLTFSLDETDDNSVSKIVATTDSKLGVKSGDDLYLLNLQSMIINSNEDEGKFELELEAKMFDSTSSIDGFVSISTPEKLVFKFTPNTSSLGPVFKTIELESGSLTVLGAGDTKGTLSVDSGTNKIKIEFDDGSGSSSAEPELILQSEYFDTSNFSLVNLTK